jgi:hypothetical protein
MTIMGDALRSITWWKLVPDQSIFVNQLNGNAAARSADGDWILAYLTRPDTVTLHLDFITASKTATGWWINPVTGDRTKTGSFPSSGNRDFIPPASWQDAVLLIEKDRD